MRIKKELLEKGIEIQKITVEAFENPGMSAPEIERVLLECLLELKEYRDAEEEGMVIKLPCKPGDKIWSAPWYEYRTKSFTVREIAIVRYNTIEIRFEEQGFIFADFKGNLDEGWYLTEGEANAAIKRMKEEEKRKE